ncbi:CCCH-type zinc finger putative transcription factor [Aphelenchoides bicaudatus]|nr:CCCH-type zinc finger putative transcription factor [Aphelenchoides bicaudatus]
MVSTGYAARNVHQYQTPGLSQTQYLKEAYGLAPSTPSAQATNDSEWPSLNNALLFGAEQQDRAQQQRNLGRRPMSQLPPNQQLNRRPASIGRMGLQQQDKTEVCRNFADTGTCRYADKCQYAHGDVEKRPIPRHPKYKTEICRSFVVNGLCLYGKRCHFIHNEEPHVLAKMIADNSAVTSPPSQMQQPPMRPNNLFSGNNGVCSSPTIASQQQQHGTPVSMTPSGNNTTIAHVASLAASAYSQNPSFFNHQFQNQLQIYNDGLKTPVQNAGTPTQAIGSGEVNSTGDSPIPSSNDSGTESPICSFSPELDDTTMFFMRMQMDTNKSAQPKLQPSAPLNLLPSSLNDAESGFSSSSSNSSNVGTKSSLNSPVIGSPPHASTNTMWSNGTVGTPTSAARLPVFERLSNGP